MGVVITSQTINSCKDINVYRDDGSSQRISATESVYIEEETPMPDECNVDVLFDITKANSDEGLVSG